MRRRVAISGAGLLALAFCAAAPLSAQPVTVPSGQDVEFVEVVRNARGSHGLTWRFRFVAPGIDRETGTISFDQAAQDMDYLCKSFAIPRLPTMGPRPSAVIVSMSARPIDFGAADPEITQFFEAYRIVDNDCIWDGL